MGSDPSDGASERKTRRSVLPIRVYRLGDEPGDDLSASTTPEQRLAMMWPLAVEAWTLASLPFPDYSRSEIPVRVVRPQSRERATEPR